MRKTPSVVSATLAVVALGLLTTPGQADIFTLLTDDFDDWDQVQAIGEVKEVKAARQEMDALRERLRRLKERDIEALFGRPTPMPGKTFAMPVAQPRGLALSGLRYGDPEMNKDHTAFYAVGESAGIEVYYGIDGVSPQAVLFYLRVDDEFPRLTKDNLEKRLAWDRERLDKLNRVFEDRRAAVFVWEVDPEEGRKLNQGDYSPDPAAKLKSWRTTGEALGYRLTTEVRWGDTFIYSWYRPDGTLTREAHSRSDKEPPHHFMWYHDDGQSALRSESCSSGSHNLVTNWRWCRPGTTDNIRYEMSDGDGRPTTWCWYDKHGKAVRSEWDTNGDGVPDRYREDEFYKKDEGLPLAVRDSWAVHPELIPADSRISDQPERRVPLRKIRDDGQAEDAPDEAEPLPRGPAVWAVGLVALGVLFLAVIARPWLRRRARG